jgi:hypothetical protein
MDPTAKKVWKATSQRPARRWQSREEHGSGQRAGNMDPASGGVVGVSAAVPSGLARKCLCDARVSIPADWQWLPCRLLHLPGSAAALHQIHAANSPTIGQCCCLSPAVSCSAVAPIQSLGLQDLSHGGERAEPQHRRCQATSCIAAAGQTHVANSFRYAKRPRPATTPTPP